MANEINIDLGADYTGLSINAELIKNNTYVYVLTLTESSTALGHYSGDMPAIAAGIYNVRFLDVNGLIGTGQIVWDGTAEKTLLDIYGEIDYITGQVDLTIKKTPRIV